MALYAVVGQITDIPDMSLYAVRAFSTRSKIKRLYYDNIHKNLTVQRRRREMRFNLLFHVLLIVPKSYLLFH